MNETPRLRTRTPFNRTVRKVQSSILGEKTNIPGTPMDKNKTPFKSVLKTTNKNLALTQNTKKSLLKSSKKLLVFKDQDNSEEEVEYCPPTLTIPYLPSEEDIIDLKNLPKMKAVHDRKADLEKTNSFLNGDIPFDLDRGIEFDCGDDFKNFQFEDMDLSIDKLILEL